MKILLVPFTFLALVVSAQDSVPQVVESNPGDTNTVSMRDGHFALDNRNRTQVQKFIDNTGDKKVVCYVLVVDNTSNQSSSIDCMKMD